MTTLFGPRLSAGSSVATAGSGAGLNQPACSGRVGSARSIACSPAECQVTSARSVNTVGLCDEYEVNGSSAGVVFVHVSRRCLYSPTITGASGWETSIRCTHPHGQPKLCGNVNVPYTSSVVSTSGLFGPGTCTAECDSAQPSSFLKQLNGEAPQRGRVAGGGRRASPRS